MTPSTKGGCFSGGRGKKPNYVTKNKEFYNAKFYNSTKKRQHYRTSDSDRKVNRNIYPDAVTRDRMCLIDPKSGQLEPIHHCCLVEEL